MTDLANSAGTAAQEHRHNDPDLFYLVQLDPSTLVDGVAVENGYLADDIVMTGGMRETCPVCKTAHLKMVLRQKNVKRAHMFCEQCTRCFDAVYRNGMPALSMA